MSTDHHIIQSIVLFKNNSHISLSALYWMIAFALAIIRSMPNIKISPPPNISDIFVHPLENNRISIVKSSIVGFVMRPTFHKTNPLGLYSMHNNSVTQHNSWAGLHLVWTVNHCGVRISKPVRTYALFKRNSFFKKRLCIMYNRYLQGRLTVKNYLNILLLLLFECAALKCLKTCETYQRPRIRKAFCMREGSVLETLNCGPCLKRGLLHKLGWGSYINPNFTNEEVRLNKGR